MKYGLINYKGRLLISPCSPLIQTLISKHHDTPQGHSGYAKTMQRLKKIVNWKGLKNSVREYSKLCDICQRAKYENLNPAGLLQPLPISEQSWEEITMDFIDCLSAIFVVADRLTKYLTKYAHFVPLSHPYTSKMIAGVFFENIYKFYGLPKVIIFDRDSLFLSRFWLEF